MIYIYNLLKKKTQSSKLNWGLVFSLCSYIVGKISKGIHIFYNILYTKFDQRIHNLISKLNGFWMKFNNNGLNVISIWED